VLFEVVVIPGQEGTFAPGTFTGGYANDYWNPGPRGIAADAAGNVWAGTYSTKMYYYLAGDTGQILRTIDVSSVNHTAYGAVIDAQGILWSSSLDKNHVLRLDPSDDSFAAIYIGHQVYGLGLDQQNHLFIAGWTSVKLSRVNVLTGQKEWTVDGVNESRGVAITDDGDVWTANSAPGTVTRWTQNGVIKAHIPVGNTPTGVSVDAAGKVWVVNNGDEYIHRINPATDSIELSKRLVGATHYGYSDMTGIVARNVATRIGIWSLIHSAGLPDAAWEQVLWNAVVPEGTSLKVRVRSSNNKVSWSNWEEAANGEKLAATPRGKFLQVQVTMQILSGDASPILYDLTVAPLIDQLPKHPADINPADNSMAISEVTTYAAVWKKGQLWSVAPIVIPINYVTRAGALWAGGEAYVFDPEVPTAPLWWVNPGGAGGGKHGLPQLAGASPAEVGGAARVLPATYVPNLPLTVTVAVADVVSVRAYAVEEAPPSGWTVFAISHEGEFDPVNRRVKWGPFLDNAPRTLTYQVTPPESARGSALFAGVASWDGVDTPVEGRQSIAASSTIASSTAVSSLPDKCTAGIAFTVSIAATPAVDVSAYAVEDQPPAGWEVTGISEGGVWDAVNQKVKWGPFFDHAARTVSYVVTPPGTAAGVARFVGTASFDSVAAPITGQRQTVAGEVMPPTFVSVLIQADGAAHLVLKGTIGAACQVEASVDLRTWTFLQSVNIGPQGTVVCTDDNAKQFRKRFYRAKLVQ
jgi:hypothetical protein